METYMLLLYVTLEQEDAIRNLFENKGWTFSKSDVHELRKTESLFTGTTNGCSNKNAAIPGPPVLTAQDYAPAHQPDIENSLVMGEDDAGDEEDLEDHPEEAELYLIPQPRFTDQIIENQDEEEKRETGSEDRLMDNEDHKVSNIKGGKSVKGRRRKVTKRSNIRTKKKKKQLEEEVVEKNEEEKEDGRTKKKWSRPKKNNPVKGELLAEGCRDERQNNANVMRKRRTGQGRVPQRDCSENKMESHVGKRRKGSGTKVEKRKLIKRKGTKKSKYGSNINNRSEDRILTEEVDSSVNAETKIEEKNVQEKDMSSQSTGKAKYHCEECGRDFKKEWTLRGHKREGKCRFVCPYCGKIFSSHLYSNWKLHLKCHRQERNFVCDICDQKFFTEYHLRNHRQGHSGEKPFICEICSAAYSSEKGLSDHKRRLHGNPVENEPCMCEFCGKSFSSRQRCLHHINATHKAQPFECPTCHKILSNEKVYKYRHAKTHINTSDAYVHQCRFCPKKFKFRDQIWNHEKRHQNLRSHFCSECGKGFYGKQHLIQHERIHSGEKPFQCSLCTYRCNVKGNLTLHMKTHTKSQSQQNEAGQLANEQPGLFAS